MRDLPLPRGLEATTKGQPRLRRAVEASIADPLARHGIVLDRTRVALLAAATA